MNKTTSTMINIITAFKTKEFGHHYWYTLFTMILGGSFPQKVDFKNNEHKKIIKYYKYTLEGLIYTLPCSICRKSYIDFYKKYNINKFLGSKAKLAYWLYLIRDLVNKKLINQETKLIKQGKLKDYITKPSPSFKDVISHYYKTRAMSCKSTCS
jgi:hypothetical protein